MIRAVAAQMIMVSTKTPSDWTVPALDRARRWRWRATLGGTRCPCRPRWRTVRAYDAVEHGRGDPAGEPPAICCKPKAPPMISAKACGRLPMLSPMITGPAA